MAGQRKRAHDASTLSRRARLLEVPVSSLPSPPDACHALHVLRHVAKLGEVVADPLLDHVRARLNLPLGQYMGLFRTHPMAPSDVAAAAALLRAQRRGEGAPGWSDDEEEDEEASELEARPSGSRLGVPGQPPSPASAEQAAADRLAARQLRALDRSLAAAPQPRLRSPAALTVPHAEQARRRSPRAAHASLRATPRAVPAAQARPPRPRAGSHAGSLTGSLDGDGRSSVASTRSRRPLDSRGDAESAAAPAAAPAIDEEASSGGAQLSLVTQQLHELSKRLLLHYDGVRLERVGASPKLAEELAFCCRCLRGALQTSQDLMRTMRATFATIEAAWTGRASDATTTPAGPGGFLGSGTDFDAVAAAMAPADGDRAAALVPLALKDVYRLCLHSIHVFDLDCSLFHNRLRNALQAQRRDRIASSRRASQAAWLPRDPAAPAAPATRLLELAGRVDDASAAAPRSRLQLLQLHSRTTSALDALGSAVDFYGDAAIRPQSPGPAPPLETAADHSPPLRARLPLLRVDSPTPPSPPSPGPGLSPPGSPRSSQSHPKPAPAAPRPASLPARLLRALSLPFAASSPATELYYATTAAITPHLLAGYRRAGFLSARDYAVPAPLADLLTAGGADTPAAREELRHMRAREGASSSSVADYEDFLADPGLFFTSAHSQRGPAQADAAQDYMRKFAHKFASASDRRGRERALPSLLEDAPAAPARPPAPLLRADGSIDSEGDSDDESAPLLYGGGQAAGKMGLAQYIYALTLRYGPPAATDEASVRRLLWGEAEPEAAPEEAAGRKLDWSCMGLDHRLAYRATQPAAPAAPAAAGQPSGRPLLDARVLWRQTWLVGPWRMRVPQPALPAPAQSAAVLGSRAQAVQELLRVCRAAWTEFQIGTPAAEGNNNRVPPFLWRPHAADWQDNDVDLSLRVMNALARRVFALDPCTGCPDASARPSSLVLPHSPYTGPQAYSEALTRDRWPRPATEAAPDADPGSPSTEPASLPWPSVLDPARNPYSPFAPLMLADLFTPRLFRARLMTWAKPSHPQLFVLHAYLRLVNERVHAARVLTSAYVYPALALLAAMVCGALLTNADPAAPARDDPSDASDAAGASPPALHRRVLASLAALAAHYAAHALPLLAQVLALEPTLFPENLRARSLRGIERGVHWAPARLLVRETDMLARILEAADLHVLPRATRTHAYVDVNHHMLCIVSVLHSPTLLSPAPPAAPSRSAPSTQSSTSPRAPTPSAASGAAARASASRSTPPCPTRSPRRHSAPDADTGSAPPAPAPTTPSCCAPHTASAHASPPTRSSRAPPRCSPPPTSSRPRANGGPALPASPSWISRTRPRRPPPRCRCRWRGCSPRLRAGCPAAT
jgi:hypothetical protein